HNYMFVDHSGLRVAVKPIDVLAEEIDQGQARILPPRVTAPLVDRALAAIVRVLHRFSGRLPDSAQGTDTPGTHVVVMIATAPRRIWKCSSGIPGSAWTAWPTYR